MKKLLWAAVFMTMCSAGVAIAVVQARRQWEQEAKEQRAEALKARLDVIYLEASDQMDTAKAEIDRIMDDTESSLLRGDPEMLRRFRASRAEASAQYERDSEGSRAEYAERAASLRRYRAGGR